MNLEVKQEAVEAIATKAYAEGMGGARNLYSQLHTILKGVEFEYFGTGKQADVIVYADDVEGIKVRVKEYGNRKKKENGNSAVINQEEIGTAQKSL
jgi:ATP-dependent protease Clp ATPase subunit